MGLARVTRLFILSLSVLAARAALAAPDNETRCALRCDTSTAVWGFLCHGHGMSVDKDKRAEWGALCEAQTKLCVSSCVSSADSVQEVERNPALIAPACRGPVALSGVYESATDRPKAVFVVTEITPNPPAEYLAYCVGPSKSEWDLKIFAEVFDEKHTFATKRWNWMDNRKKLIVECKCLSQTQPQNETPKAPASTPTQGAKRTK